MTKESNIYETAQLTQLCKIVEDEFNSSLAAGYSVKEACKLKRGCVWLRVLLHTEPHLRLNAFNQVEISISTLIEGLKVEVILYHFTPIYK